MERGDELFNLAQVDPVPGSDDSDVSQRCVTAFEANIAASSSLVCTSEE